ncbi:hypothetical protein Tco_0043758, partial [Tanacetum coccineum]
MTVERSLGRGFRKFKSRKLSALKGLTLKNLVPSKKELLSKTSTNFTMLAMNKMIGALLLKLGIGCLRLMEQVVREYVMEFLSSFTFKDHIEELNAADTMVFQLGEERGSMTMRQFIQALGLHSGKEKVTLDDLFLLHSMDGGVNVDVPWHVAKFLCDKAKGSKWKSPIVGAHLIGRIASYYGLMTLGALMNVTLGPKTLSMSVTKLVDLGIRKYNG